MPPSSGAPRLSQRVYDELREAIIRGQFRPNQRLVETDLARQLELSRTPVREGLQRLEADGLVRGERHGWVVHEHTLTEILEIYETRAALEGYATHLAAERLSRAELAEIEAIQGPTEIDWTSVPRDDIVEINARFHRAVLEGCGNSRLLATISKNQDFYFNHRVAMAYTDEHVRASMRGHHRILDALRRKDGAVAEALVREHILEAFEAIKDRYALQAG